MSSFPMRRPADGERARVARSGFTLIELLVAMVISLLLAGSILQVMQGQARFVGAQGSRQEVQQNARGSLELMASELRSVPPGGITEASQNRVQFLLPRAWGILCTDVSSQLMGTVWVLFPQGSFPVDFPTNTQLANPTDWGMALPLTSSADSWSAATVSSTTAGTIPAGTCEFDQTMLANHDAREITYSGLANLPLGAVAGGRVFLYQNVTYEAGTDGTGAEIWLKRNNGVGATQPLAGPLGPQGSAASAGLVFRYHCRNGRMSTAPGSSATGWPDLTRVQVEVTMQSQEGNTANRQQERDSTMVYLRNSTGGADCTL